MITSSSASDDSFPDDGVVFEVTASSWYFEYPLVRGYELGLKMGNCSSFTSSSSCCGWLLFTMLLIKFDFIV